jgi:2-polyprenyl-3-methyl-5-hydroxy-6-metoxy-1,4-benzoquinol methylase
MGAGDYEGKVSGYFEHGRPDMLAFVPEGVRRVLEVGCGAGDFGAAVRALRSAEVVGLELVAEAAQAARGKLDRVIVVDAERDQLDLPESYFDCLICNDVLEHFPNPWATLAKLVRHLRPDAWIVASIPNVRFHKVMRRLVWPGEWRYEDAGVLDRTHLRFFTRASAAELLRSAGFDIVREQGIGATKFPVWLRLIDLLSGGAFEDARYHQFAFVGRLKGSSATADPA